jgi:2-methylcitrate dehydratase PrpD
MNAVAARAQATLNQRLAAYICEEQFQRIDPAAIARAKHVIAYHVGMACRGLRYGDPDSQQAIRVARELSEHGGTSRIICTPHRATLVDAALANSTLMRSFAQDDVIFPAGIHPGLVTIPVALGLAERLHTSGAALLTAIVIGYEILGKFGTWTWSVENPRRATMPFGSFGAIATAAPLLKLTQRQTAHALGYAAHTAMGVAEGDAGPITHFYGMVCRNGITGAYLAQAGGESSPCVLEGRFGFLESFVGSAAVDADVLLRSLGRDYVILDSCEKRYPGTALNQVPIELMRGLVAEHRLTAADIVAVHIDVPIERRNFATSHSTGPFTHRIHATASAAFQLAIMVLDGELNPARYDELANPDILALARKMHFEFVTGKPIRYCRLTVHTNAGQVLVREGDHFSFELEDDRVIMEREARGVLPPEKVERFAELLQNLEKLDDAAMLVACLVP